MYMALINLLMQSRLPHQHRPHPWHPQHHLSLPPPALALSQHLSDSLPLTERPAAGRLALVAVLHARFSHQVLVVRRARVVVGHCRLDRARERASAIGVLNLVHGKLLPLVADPVGPRSDVQKGRAALLPEEAPPHNKVPQRLGRVHVLARLHHAGVKEVTEAVKALGPNQNFVKTTAKVA